MINHVVMYVSIIRVHSGQRKLKLRLLAERLKMPWLLKNPEKVKLPTSKMGSSPKKKFRHLLTREERRISSGSKRRRGRAEKKSCK